MITPNQVQDIFQSKVGRTATPEEVSRFQNANFDTISGATFLEKNKSTYAPTAPTPTGTPTTAMITPNAQNAPQSTTTAPTPTPTTTTPPQSISDVSGAIIQPNQPQESDTSRRYKEVQTQVRDLDNQINSAYINKKKEIEAQGGIVNETQLRAQVLNELAPIVAQRKSLAATQSDLGRQLSQERTMSLQQERLALQEESIASRERAQASAQDYRMASLEDRKTIAQAKINITSASSLSPDQVKSIGDAIISGKQSPVLTGLYRSAPAIKAYLASQGFDQAKAEQSYKAEIKFLSTLNGSQIIKQQQAVNFVQESIPNVRSAVENWNNQVGAGRFPPLNKVNLIAAENGTYGVDAQVAATQLQTWITDMASELSTVYKGGNSPTDKTLEQANKTLDENWSYESLNAALDTISTTTQLRLNSINDLHPYGIDSTYAPSKNQESQDLMSSTDFNW